SGAGSVRASGGVDFGGAGNISLGGVHIDVGAFNLGSGSSRPGVEAIAQFNQTNTAVNLTVGSDGIFLNAFASSPRGGGALAEALVNIHEAAITIDGPINVNAGAVNVGGGSVESATGDANAQAHLELHASAGSVTVGGPANVTAFALDGAAGQPIAS